MPVDEDINLDKPLTDAQIKKLERDAERLEQAALKAQAEAAKIQKEVAEAANVLLNAEKFMGSSPLNSMGGNDEFESKASNFLGIGGGNVGVSLPSKGRRSAQGVSASPVAGITVDEIENIIKLETDELQNKIKESEMKIKAIQKIQRDQERHNQYIISQVSQGGQKLQQAFSFQKNPIGSIQNKLMGVIGKAGLYGAIAVISFEIAQQAYHQIMNEVKDLYKAGGPLDVRKDTLNALAQISSLESIIDHNQGRVFFTSSTGEILRQGVPQDYNTRGRVNGYKQYLQEYDR